MKKRILIVCFSVLAVAVAAVAIFPAREPAMQLPEGVRNVLEAQQRLPAEEVQALQDLRLLAAVQSAYFNTQGAYGTPEELIAGGVLDPQWPRTSPEAYTISCQVFEERLGFACYADPVAPFTTYYSVNPSQAVRLAKGRRPDDSSPAFGSTSGGL